MLYKVVYNNIAWKNMIAFIESDTESEALKELLKFNNYDEDLKVISIDSTEKRTRYIVKQLHQHEHDVWLDQRLKDLQKIQDNFNIIHTKQKS